MVDSGVLRGTGDVLLSRATNCRDAWEAAVAFRSVDEIIGRAK
jgi:hypothetical protein